jgi:hypothetical protein
LWPNIVELRIDDADTGGSRSYPASVWTIWSKKSGLIRAQARGRSKIIAYIGTIFD